MQHFQRRVTYAGYILCGVLALGAFLDSVGNASSFVTPAITYSATAVIVLVLIYAQFALPKFPVNWKFSNDKILSIRKIGIKPKLFMTGMVMLLWFPRIWPSTSDASQDGREIQKRLNAMSELLGKIDKRTEVLVREEPQRRDLPILKEDKDGCSIFVNTVFAPIPFKDAFSNFLLNPRPEGNFDKKLELGKTYKTCITMNPNSLLSYLDGLPDEALFHQRIPPFQERRLTFGCASDRKLDGGPALEKLDPGCLPPPRLIIMPEGAQRVGERVVIWTPSQSQAGTRQYIALLHDQPAQIKARFRPLSALGGPDSVSETEMPFPAVATVFRYNVDSLVNRVSATFERVNNEKSIFRTTAFSIQITNISRQNILVQELQLNHEDILRGLLLYLDGLPDDKMLTMSVLAGKLITLKTPENQALLYMPKGARYVGHQMKWTPEEDQIGSQSYIIINQPVAVQWKHCLSRNNNECESVTAGPGIPGVFAVIRLKVQKTISDNKNLTNAKKH